MWRRTPFPPTDWPQRQRWETRIGWPSMKPSPKKAKIWWIRYFRSEVFVPRDSSVVNLALEKEEKNLAFEDTLFVCSFFFSSSFSLFGVFSLWSVIFRIFRYRFSALLYRLSIGGFVLRLSLKEKHFGCLQGVYQQLTFKTSTLLEQHKNINRINLDTVFAPVLCSRAKNLLNILFWRQIYFCLN